MEKTVSAFEARRQFGKILDAVAGRGDSVIIERHGAPAAAVVPMDRYNQWRMERQRFLDLLSKAQSNADLSPEDADRIAAEAVAAARAERRQQRAAS